MEPTTLGSVTTRRKSIDTPPGGKKEKFLSRGLFCRNGTTLISFFFDAAVALFVFQSTSTYNSQ